MLKRRSVLMTGYFITDVNKVETWGFMDSLQKSVGLPPNGSELSGELVYK